MYDDLVRQGKLRYVALSNYPAWQVTQALWIADDRHLHAPVCVQVKYNLIDRAAERELAPACVQFGLSLVPYAPLHGGLLAGMQVLEREVQGDMRFSGPGFSEAELHVGRAVERLATSGDCSPTRFRSRGFCLARRSHPPSSVPRRSMRSRPTPRRRTLSSSTPSSTPYRR